MRDGKDWRDVRDERGGMVRNERDGDGGRDEREKRLKLSCP